MREQLSFCVSFRSSAAACRSVLHSFDRYLKAADCGCTSQDDATKCISCMISMTASCNVEVLTLLSSRADDINDNEFFSLGGPVGVHALHTQEQGCATCSVTHAVNSRQDLGPGVSKSPSAHCSLAASWVHGTLTWFNWTREQAPNLLRVLCERQLAASTGCPIGGASNCHA